MEFGQCCVETQHCEIHGNEYSQSEDFYIKIEDCKKQQADIDGGF
jgi:hypothetical protein